jgi:hypothetical protein
VSERREAAQAGFEAEAEKQIGRDGSVSPQLSQAIRFAFHGMRMNSARIRRRLFRF